MLDRYIFDQFHIDIIEQVKRALLPLAHLIQTDDEVFLSHACLAIFALNCDSEDIIQAVTDTGVFPRLIELLLSMKKILLDIIPYHSLFFNL